MCIRDRAALAALAAAAGLARACARGSLRRSAVLVLLPEEAASALVHVPLVTVLLLRALVLAA